MAGWQVVAPMLVFGGFYFERVDIVGHHEQVFPRSKVFHCCAALLQHVSASPVHMNCGHTMLLQCFPIHGSHHAGGIGGIPDMRNKQMNFPQGIPLIPKHCQRLAAQRLCSTCRGDHYRGQRGAESLSKQMLIRTATNSHSFFEIHRHGCPKLRYRQGCACYKMGPSNVSD